MCATSVVYIDPVHLDKQDTFLPPKLIRVRVTPLRSHCITIDTLTSKVLVHMFYDTILVS